MTPCVLCGIRCPPEADAVNAGGDVGRVHDACFQAWDTAAEAAEMALFDGSALSLIFALEDRPRGRVLA